MITRPRLAPALVAALLACGAAALAPGAAHATNSLSYYSARTSQAPFPAQLSAEERDYYRQLFDAIEQERWQETQSLLAARTDGLLHPVARARYYLAARSPRVELAQIEAWMERGRNLPQAAQLGRLALRRGASAVPALPHARELTAREAFPRRQRPRPTNDGTMPEATSSAILQAISQSDPDQAHLVLDEVDALLSPAARAEWRQRVAWSFFIENRDTRALALARAAAQGAGPWVAEGEWVAGLAAWRLGDCALAGSAFARAGDLAEEASLRSAGYFWAARAARLCRDPAASVALLRQAAQDDRTLYGMLAAEQLGQALPARVENADLGPDDWHQLSQIENVRIAIALDEIGRDALAGEVLIHQGRIGDPALYPALTRLARALGYAQTQLAMAHNAPQGSAPDQSAYFPAPRIEPSGGWKIDPALALAHIHQESAFRPRALSPANARGLMQITPITARQHARCVGEAEGEIDAYDPATNLALGQCNLAMLRADPATSGHLPKVMAAYNAGMTPVRRWNTQVRDQGDPLLYMEAIPYWETRGYVAIVMRNYWMYERQARSPSPSRLALAQNQWPRMP